MVNTKAIEDIVIKNKIAMQNSYKNKSGDMVLVCESTEESEKLKTLVKSSHGHIEMERAPPKMKAISVVGLPTEYTKDEFTNLIQSQNTAIREFGESFKFDYDSHEVLH